MKEIITDLKKTIVFLGELVNKKEDGKIKQVPRFFGTGFLIRARNIYCLVTAKHVVQDPKSKQIREILTFFNNKDKKISIQSISQMQKEWGTEWVFHENEKVDIAITPFAVNMKNDDVKVIPDKLFLSTEDLFESMDVFFLSFQPGIEHMEQIKKINPILRKGIISLIKEDNTFYIDGFCYPGNSGSPVFLSHTPFYIEKKQLMIGVNKLGGKFIGIIGEYLPYQEVAVSEQTKRPRIIFEENTGLSKVWSISLINEILDSEKFKEQSKRLRPKE